MIICSRSNLWKHTQDYPKSGNQMVSQGCVFSSCQVRISWLCFTGNASKTQFENSHTNKCYFTIVLTAVDQKVNP